MSTAPVLRASGLARRFGKRWAVAHVNLEVGPRERLLVLGANGSGKTTLLRTLATLLGPSQGTLELFGEDSLGLSDDARGRIALVSHQPGLYEDLSADDHLRFFARLTGRGVPGDLLARVGLEARPDPVRLYSAGMRKRLGLALMLLREPSLVLLDEPFGQLDPNGMAWMEDLVRSLDATVILASHQVVRASALCDRALVLSEGLPRWLGPAAQAPAAWRQLHPGALP